MIDSICLLDGLFFLLLRLFLGLSGFSRQKGWKNVDKITDPSLRFVNPQLQDEIHHLSKKTHSNEKGGFNFLGGLKNKSVKLQSEIEHYEIHDEMIERSLKDIKTGGDFF